MDAVSHVSFSVAKGEIVALVGESGSGKTVSALSILRLLPYPSASHPSGEIIFGGKDLLKAPGHAMRDIRGEKISIIFQEPMTSLNPLHTIEKQVGEIMKLHHGLDDATARARVLELLRKVGLDNPERRLQRLPAPALRRAAPARDDRHGAGQRARPADRRRAHHRARRHHPGADPRAAEERCSASSAWPCC